ncbi:hypothetical protein [Fusobacterium varium]|uniref:hypothetical protein n=1 Tax=Fusobacterium varium TaxID=856 RepID=UPI002FE43AD6
MEEKKVRKKKKLSSFTEGEDKLLERLKKMKEDKKKYIFNMFGKIFTDILNNDELLEILDENKEDKKFQESLSNILKQEILKKSEKNNLKQEDKDE